MDLIDNLVKEGWLKTPRIIEAFKKIKRADFLQEDMKDLAELNEALPIGWGQTISQPLVVAFMIEQLQPKPGEKILDIGSGSGWTTALLAYIVSQKGISNFPGREADSLKGCFPISKSQGKVIAIEIIPELKEFGEKNVAKYNFIEKEIVEFVCADGSKGYKKEAPFDNILVSAAVYLHTKRENNLFFGDKGSGRYGVRARKIPIAWREQLKLGGRIVVPIESSIYHITKKSETAFEEKEYPGFAFVPLIQK